MHRIMKLIFTVEEPAVGGLIADMTGRPGVLSMEHEVVHLKSRRSKVDAMLSSALPRSEGKGKRNANGTTANVIRSALATRPLTSAEVILQTGMKKQTVYSQLSLMKKNKEIRQDRNEKWIIRK